MPLIHTEKPNSPARPAAARGALAALSLAMMLASLGTSIANVGLPTLTQAFAASFQQVQWVVLAYLLAITTLVVSVGRLGDRIGRRRLFLGGIALFTIASGFCAAAPTLSLLIAARAVQGLGAAILMALTLALVGETVPKARTGRAMGLLGTMSAAGTALGPALGGLLIAATGWRSLFWIMLPIGALTFGLALRYLPGPTLIDTRTRPKFDLWGSALLALTLAAYALAMTVGRGQFSRDGLILLLGAAGGAAVFVGVEARVAAPLIQLAALRKNGIAASLTATALVASVMMATLVVGPFYLSQGLGLPAAQVGATLSLGPILSAVAGVWAGRLVDRFGAAIIGGVGLIDMIAGTLALAFLPALLGLPGYLVGIVILTPGYQLFQAANNTHVMSDVAPDQRGVMSGLLSLSRNLGLITGASLMGAIFAAAVGPHEIGVASGTALTVGLQVTFALSAALVGVALMLWFWGGLRRL